MGNLSLRLRVFLFFCFIGLGSIAITLCALFIGYRQLADPEAISAFVTSAIVAGFGIAGLCVFIWLLFDENVARPIEGLASGLRARAHAGVDHDLDMTPARYLGDLAPAADAVARELGSATIEVAQTVASETARLEAETERLTTLLTQIPVATVLLNTAGEIVLYDGQAADCLAAIAPPRLKAPISDYLDLGPLRGATQATRTTIHDRRGRPVEVSCSPMEGGGALLMLHSAPALTLRKLVYDFDLLQGGDAAELAPALYDTPLDRLSYCVVDTETTGLDPKRDALVQIAALRVVNGRARPDEVMDTYVDPARPIPAAATAVHGIHDHDVTGAPSPARATATLRAFCGGDVFVAHNAPFDLGLLRHATSPDAGHDWQVPVLDTVLLSAVIWGTTADHTLDALCARLGVVIPPEVRHTAMGDAQATAKALTKLIPMVQARGVTTFGALIRETRRHGRLLQDMNPTV